jgi:hypothetical protein
MFLFSSSQPNEYIFITNFLSRRIDTGEDRRGLAAEASALTSEKALLRGNRDKGPPV